MSLNVELNDLPEAFNLPADYTSKIVRRNVQYKAKIICCVPNCYNRASKTITMHKFPRKQYLCRLWKLKIKISKPIKSTLVVCSQHFTDGDYLKECKSKRRLLKSDAIPSQNLESSAQRITLSAKRRADRMNASQNQNRAEVNAADSDTISNGEPDSSEEEVLSVETSEAPKVEEMAIATSDACIQVNTLVDIFPLRISVFDKIKACDKFLNSWTGIISFQVLEAIQMCVEHVYSSVHGILPPIASTKRMSLEEKVVLCFVKLKTNLSFECTAYLFSITAPTCSRVFKSTIPLIREAVDCVVHFSSVGEIRSNLPKCFENEFSAVRGILHCLEVQSQIPNCVNCKSSTFSQYKNTNTMKFMICITPAGTISNVSAGYPGKASDTFIFNEENLIDKFDEGDAIIVDTGFLIEDETRARGIRLIRATSFQPHTTQFEGADVLASTNVSVARVIQRMKVFAVMSDKIEYNILSYIDDIVLIIAAVVNLSTPILSSDKF